MIRRCKIKDIGYFFGGLTGKNKDDFNIGNAKYVSYMTVFSNPSLPDSITDIVSISENEKQNKIQKGDVLFTGSSETPDECGMSCVVTKDVVGDVYLNSFCFGLRFHNNDILNSSYLAHYFRSNYARKQISKTANGVTRFNISKKLFSEIEIVYPSIKVQEEIVEILDSFTNLIDALNEELSLRKKQFEYYREKLITAKCYISVMKPICELAEDIFSGATPSTKIEKYWTNGDIPWMSSGDIHQKTINDISTFITKKGYDSCSTKMVPIQSIVIALAGQGKTRGTVGITNTALCTNQSLCAIVPNKNEIIPKFLFYYLDKEYDNLRRISSGDGTRGGLNLQMIRNYIIEYPSLDIQKSIVEKLDAFESLISSLKEEIALRQKQYEYYREKLLTFN